MTDETKPYTPEELDADMREYGAPTELRLRPTVEALEQAQAEVAALRELVRRAQSWIAS